MRERVLILRGLRAIAGARLDDEKKSWWRLNQCSAIAHFILSILQDQTFDRAKSREERREEADGELVECGKVVESKAGSPVGPDPLDMVEEYTDAARRMIAEGDVLNQWNTLRKVSKEAHVLMESIRSKVREELDGEEPSKHDLYCCCGDFGNERQARAERDLCLADICEGCQAGYPIEDEWHDDQGSDRSFKCAAVAIRRRWEKGG